MDPANATSLSGGYSYHLATPGSISVGSTRLTGTSAETSKSTAQKLSTSTPKKSQELKFGMMAILSNKTAPLPAKKSCGQDASPPCPSVSNEAAMHSPPSCPPTGKLQAHIRPPYLPGGTTGAISQATQMHNPTGGCVGSIHDTAVNLLTSLHHHHTNGGNTSVVGSMPSTVGFETIKSHLFPQGSTGALLDPGYFPISEWWHQLAASYPGFALGFPPPPHHPAGLPLGPPPPGPHHHHAHHPLFPSHSHHLMAGGVGAGLFSCGPGGGGGGYPFRSKPRRAMLRRAVFSDNQRKGLETAFTKHAYITKPDRKELAEKLGLKDAQVKIWFQNRRMKWRNAKEREQLVPTGVAGPVNSQTGNKLSTSNTSNPSCSPQPLMDTAGCSALEIKTEGHHLHSSMMLDSPIESDPEEDEEEIGEGENCSEGSGLLDHHHILHHPSSMLLQLSDERRREFLFNHRISMPSAPPSAVRVHHHLAALSAVDHRNNIDPEINVT